ncbi:hypothetical protein BDZ89DRAFT_1163943 [Hymenopellis radicata]|nr:hypothetical protein BDZ89DRAFT_1163943 [Hymenopellis radicata]
MHALLFFIDFFPLPLPPDMPKCKRSRSPSPSDAFSAEGVTNRIPSLQRPPITPRPMRSLPKKPLQTPGNKGASGQLNFAESYHRASVDVYVDEDLQTSRVFFPTDVFLHVLLGLPKDWESDEPMQSLITSIMKTTAYSKARAAFKHTCVGEVKHESQLYDDYIDMCNAATRTIAKKDGQKDTLWSYRQDHNALLGSSAKLTPDVMSVSEKLWKGSGNKKRTGHGPEYPIGWPQTQIVQDMKAGLRSLDRGSTCPYTIIGLDGLDPRDWNELVHAVEKAEEREGLSKDFSNNLRNARKRQLQSSPEDTRVTKRSKSHVPLHAIAASVGQAPVAPTIKASDDSGDRHSVSLQCARYALEVLSSAGFRSHSFGLLIGLNEIQILYYDRSIIAVSQPFQMVDLEVRYRTQCLTERRFVAVLISLQRATLAQRGIMEYLMPDPFLEVYRNYTEDMAKDPKTLFIGRQIKLQVNGKSVFVTLGRILMRQPGIIGRNTCVVEATSDAWPGKELVVKISWPASSRVPENEFVDKITESVEAEGEAAAWVLDHIPTVLHSQDFPLPPDSPGSRLREYLAGPDVNERPGTPSTSGHFDEAGDYAQVLFDVLQVHRWIYDYPRIMHRDLSQGNIMWHVRKGRICGVLNDFDLSSYRGASGGSSKQRTGTRPYMAHELHDLDTNGDPPVHLYRHDLESIFYVIILLTCAYALNTELSDSGSYLHAVKSSPCRLWLSMTDTQLYKEKCVLITDLNGRSIPDPDDSFKGFAVWINQIHAQFEMGMINKARARRAAATAALLDDEDMDVDDNPPAVAVFDEATLDGAVSYASILGIMKTFGKDDSGKKRRRLQMMYPISKED